jgi:hypothetical protein
MSCLSSALKMKAVLSIVTLVPTHKSTRNYKSQDKYRHRLFYKPILQISAGYTIQVLHLRTNHETIIHFVNTDMNHPRP